MNLFCVVRGCLLILVSVCGLVSLSFQGVFKWLPASPGGIVGELTASGLKQVFSATGGRLFLMAAFLVGVTLLTGLSWLDWSMPQVFIQRVCLRMDGPGSFALKPAARRNGLPVRLR